MNPDDRTALTALLELSGALLAARSPGQVEGILTRLSVSLLGTRYALFLRFDPGADVLRVTTQAGEHARELGVTLARGQGLSWQAALGAAPVLHVQRAAFPPGAVLLDGSPRQSALFAPLRTPAGELLGVLSVGRLAPEFSARDEGLLRTFANTGTVALERARETARALATREGTLLALGLALEARDYETQGHTARTVALSLRLGRALGLDDEDLDLLRQGAYLHDIGKLSVPDGVLLKPGRLTPDEWGQMQAHVQTGEALARRIPGLAAGVLAVIRSHHERWDGGGYPDGLKGEAIAPLARIFAVVDVFDALTHARPYRAALTVEEALALLRAESGRQFDPRVIEAFLSLRLQSAPDPAGVAWDQP
ncbi:HD-GYP domain-containing protein [Deinococcus budaensis]|uniref:Putative nucleotidyltransferase with HDIG domain n=1 Tax=Deinococcus budaensis TaxID=1665626 RepID=A0A7W8LQG2_9DEIO|nr:HD domain-containing phosphohydrolase [Deinococcus budaensis]MBB5234575.1 putative nucleotidyltransferase with HDIG domain [Deinococcus budaensis]